MCGVTLALVGASCDDAARLAASLVAETAVPLSRRGPDERAQGEAVHSQRCGSSGSGSGSGSGGGSGGGSGSGSGSGGGTALALAASVLRLRGEASDEATTRTPPRLPEGARGSLLAYNGEVFGGVDVDERQGDTAAVLALLEEAAGNSNGGGTTGERVIEALAALEGPWALCYLHAPSKTLYYGRDVYGRRSLLVRRSTSALPGRQAPVPVLQLCSTALDSSDSSDWEEVPPGVYTLRLEQFASGASKAGEALAWPVSSMPERLAAHRRAVMATPPPLDDAEVVAGRDEAVHDALEGLRAAVQRRCAHETLKKHTRPPDACLVEGAADELTLELPPAAVGVLFSGGVDSALIARLVADELAPGEAIDLVNVCFARGKGSPDRLSAREGAAELAACCPDREFRLVEVDSTLEEVDAQEARLRACLYPCRTHMDYNIGAALWMAASCRGRCVRYRGSTADPLACPYVGRAKVLLLGGGADEQFCGYSRHRTCYRDGGRDGLEREVALDMSRLWQRNCGRDDRLVADRSRECRSPFLDEQFVLRMLRHPLWALADLGQPPGQGDKVVLRAVAKSLGLKLAAARVKRAVHFGTRIAKERNVRDFGSNRRANKMHGGSVIVGEAPQSSAC